MIRIQAVVWTSSNRMLQRIPPGLHERYEAVQESWVVSWIRSGQLEVQRYQVSNIILQRLDGRLSIPDVVLPARTPAQLLQLATMWNLQQPAEVIEAGSMERAELQRPIVHCHGLRIQALAHSAQFRDVAS
jgi:hypothetical protein